jgi:hypothetical protein
MIRRLLITFACVAAPAAAHDFWIEPSTFRPQLGKTFTVSLLVGQDFAGDVVPRSGQLIEAFTVRDAGGDHPVNGFENQDPAGYVRVDRPGLAIIGYRSKANPLELPAEKFNQFLQQEGLDRVRELRAARGQTNKPDRERFYRYAKALIGSGDDQRLGYRFEIVSETNPPSRVRVFLEGKPLAGALVTALHRDDPSLRFSARTDASGRVGFSLRKPGVWLIKSVHMVPAPAGSNADWESLWASLTFER